MRDQQKFCNKRKFNIERNYIKLKPKYRRNKMAHKKKKGPTTNGRVLAASLIIGTEDKDSDWSYNNETRLGVLIRTSKSEKSL